jgi:hypothetical protein
MKIILFGATGMVGQGVLRECLLDPGIETVLAVGRSPAGQRHAKLREISHDNFLDYSAIESELAGYDACFFCLGVSSVGMGAAVVLPPSRRAALHDHQRATRPRHDQGGARGLSEAGAGERGHQSPLTSFRSSPTGLTPESRDSPFRNCASEVRAALRPGMAPHQFAANIEAFGLPAFAL